MKKEDKNKKISKYLSYILRHKPESINLILDSEGWADIDEIIEKTTDFKLTKVDIEYMVEENDKQRFAIKDNKIRANQGHSIKIDLALNPKKPPSILYHGTATRFLVSIKKEGLTSQSRQYVHLSQDKETALQVAKRHGKPTILEIDALEMYQDEYKFFLSQNGVWLVDNVPIKYFRELGELSD